MLLVLPLRVHQKTKPPIARRATTGPAAAPAIQAFELDGDPGDGSGVPVVVGVTVTEAVTVSWCEDDGGGGGGGDGRGVGSAVGSTKVVVGSAIVEVVVDSSDTRRQNI